MRSAQRATISIFFVATHSFQTPSLVLPNSAPGANVSGAEAFHNARLLQRNTDTGYLSRIVQSISGLETPRCRSQQLEDAASLNPGCMKHSQ